METKKIILKLRTERGMSQDELANKVMVTRQAVSRWENGDKQGISRVSERLSEAVHAGRCRCRNDTCVS